MRLPKSLAVRIGAVAAAAAIAVTGATAAASASTTAPAAHRIHRIPTTLTISNSKPVRHRHQTTAIVKGHLTAGRYNLRHMRVWLERLGRRGHWRITQMKRTRRYGHVFFRVHVYRKPATFRLVFRGTRNFAKSMSHIDTILPVTSS